MQQSSNFQKSVSAWLKTKKNTLCGKHGCSGIRTKHEHQFVNGQPAFLRIDLSLSAFTPSNKLTLNGVEYKLGLVTYGNGHHFNSCVRIQQKWYHYDGLREYHNPGSGLVRQIQPKPKAQYHQNNCVYVKC